MNGTLRRDLHRTEIVLGIIVLVIAVLRLALPSVLKSEINHRLADIEEYSGHVDDVGVHVLHGGYSMHQLVIRKKGAPGNEPFVAAADVRFTIAYRELLHGQFSSDIVIRRGAINFESAPAGQAGQNLGMEKTAQGVPKPAQPWQDVIKDLFPVKIGHLELVDSRLHYRNKGANPPVDISVEHLNLTANGLQNRPDPKAGPMPATITANGRTIGHGSFHLTIHANPLEEQPHFDLRLAVENIDLPSLNSFLEHAANVDVGRGKLQIYSEITASNGAFKGYVKPLFTDLDFHSAQDKNHSPAQRLWKDVVAATTRLMRDKQKKQVGTIVPFSGTFSSGKSIAVGTLVRTLFYNGFVEALRRGLDQNPAAPGKKT